jgi:MFS family permease
MLILTACINGLGAGILWVAQGKYISLCATSSTRGFINAYFWTIFMSSQVIGNLMAAHLLNEGADQSTLFLLFAVIALLGSMLMLALGQPIGTEF